MEAPQYESEACRCSSGFTRIYPYSSGAPGEAKAEAAGIVWKGFAPYEIWDNEVQAWNLSKTWYYKIYGTASPLPGISSSLADSSNHPGFLKNKARYQELEKKKANGTLVVDEEKGIDEVQEMKDLNEWFRKQENLPYQEGRGGGYDEDAELEC